MIICFPSGAILYYGRVTPSKCVAIVEETILKVREVPSDCCLSPSTYG
jgi:(2Fe-2S) ferredoxin